MTTNQVAYARLQEDKRHNLATEEEAKRSNKFRESEDQRHNFASEAISGRQIDVNQQHYERSDAINEIGTLGNVAHYERQDTEAARHNKASENIDVMGVQTQQERNRITESYNNAQVFLKGQEIAVNAQRVANDYAVGRQSNAIRKSEVEGKLDIEYQKLPSEIDLNQSRSRQAENAATKAVYDTILTREQTFSERAKRSKIGAETKNIESSTERNVAEIEYGKWNTILKGVDSFAKVADSFSKIINGGKRK